MKTVITFLTVFLMGTVAFADSNIPTKAAVDFDKTSVGRRPNGWVVGVTGGGLPKWSVETDTTAPSQPNVLKQSGEGTFK